MVFKGMVMRVEGRKELFLFEGGNCPGTLYPACPSST
jgi:hypothetical protein